MDFAGFREAVDVVNCVYVDVDRRYYHSNLGLPVSQHYAEIDVQPGYQRLCGQNALDYVRFRHNDNDIVRAARQQDFLRQAAAQMSTSRLIGNLDPLVRAFAKSTSTDGNLQTSRGILRLLRLAASSAGRPVRQIRFPATFVHTPAPATTVTPFGTPAAAPGLGDYVTATPEQIQRAVDQFLHPRTPRKRASPRVKPKRKQGKRRARVSAADYKLVTGLAAAKAIVRPALRHRRFELPVYAPAWLTPRGRYPQSTGVARSPRLYVITDRGGGRHRAYRLVVAGGRDGGPVLRHPGHELAQPADPQRQAPDRADGRPQLPRLLRRRAHPPRRPGDPARRLLGLEHAEPRPLQPPDARHRALAHAHPALSHVSAGRPAPPRAQVPTGTGRP